MNIFDSLFSSNNMLNEQIARELFTVIPQPGPFIAILDGMGNYWLSDEERFSQAFTDGDRLEQICARIDDGGDPVICQANDCTIIATQLLTEPIKCDEQIDCGYVIIGSEQYSPESVLTNMEMIEAIVTIDCATNAYRSFDLAFSNSARCKP